MLQEYIFHHFCIFSRYFRKLAHWDIRFHHCHPDSQQYHHTWTWPGYKYCRYTETVHLGDIWQPGLHHWRNSARRKGHCSPLDHCIWDLELMVIFTFLIRLIFDLNLNFCFLICFDHDCSDRNLIRRLTQPCKMFRTD